MTYFRSGQNRSRLRREILAAFCFNRSGRIKEKTLHIADIQGFPEFGQISARPHFLTQRAENGFPTQAYSSFTISALREAFPSKVTPAMRSSCTRLHPNAFDKDTNYFHTIQERYSSCFLYTESRVFPSLSFHKVHPFEDRPMQKSEAILGLGKILSEAIVPLRSTGLFRIILFRKATNQVGHLPAEIIE